jgi:adenine-specific DNA-methyltransferase
MATRRNLATAELASVTERIEEQAQAGPVHYPRSRPLPQGAERKRDKDLDPQIVWNGTCITLSPEQVRQLQHNGVVEIGDAQLVWRGKDQRDWADLVVQAPPIYMHEKVHPKAIIADLIRRSRERAAEEDGTPDLFADFKGLNDPKARLEFYLHEPNWSNRMILGDSLYVMASLAEREHLRGQVQCIYIDPPYGIKFNSNWQVSTSSRDVKDGKREDVSREPEQVRAFRDTWKDGIHSYLTYLRDRLSIAKELLTDSGSIFVQIGDENIHRVRAIMDEVFGESCFLSQISFKKTGFQAAKNLPNNFDYLLWYAKNADNVKFRRPYIDKLESSAFVGQDIWYDDRRGSRRRLSNDEKRDLARFDPDNIFRHKPPESSGASGRDEKIEIFGRTIRPKAGKHFSTHPGGMERVKRADRFLLIGNSLRYIEYLSGFSVTPLTNMWADTVVSGFGDPQLYVVQTSVKVAERCILMATDPGDLVLDPTCGSGTTAFVAEQWGRRWITIDTSRVALALARARIMSAKYPYYYLLDTPAGRAKQQKISGKIQTDSTTHGDIGHGFVYERAPHVTLKSIANNAEIDVIWETFQTRLESLRTELNSALGTSWQEWEIPREADSSWTDNIKELHTAWWEHRVARQKKIDASIAKNADVEFLYDRPYEDSSRIRVAGPFTVESLSPHRVVPADYENLVDTLDAAEGKRRRSKLVAPPTDFAAVVLEHLRSAGVHQTEKKGAIKFTSLQGWPGEYIAAEGRFMESERERRAAIFLGPEFGTISRIDLIAAAREATEARFDILIACAFNFDAHASELSKLGPLPILKAKMNPDLHMAGELKNTGTGNLFVVFGEPDIDIENEKDGRIRVRVRGVDVFDPNTGEIRSGDTAGIAAWFIDTDYDEESFFVRHAYFLGAHDPYKALKTALKAEVNPEAWASLYSDVSRPFSRPSTGRIAIKVINHFGDEVMKVFSV